MKKFIKFMKSSSLSYEMNGEPYYEKWFEISAIELGITEHIINHYGSLDAVCKSIIDEHPMFKENGWNLYEILGD